MSEPAGQPSKGAFLNDPALRGLKVAVAHEWLVNNRGGERVLEAILEIFPQAPLYTLVYKPGSCPGLVESRPIHASFLNRIPGAQTRYPNLLPLMPLAARSMKVPNDYDLVISSSHCVIKGLRISPRTRHLSYVHSPMRYMYDQFDVYFPPQGSWLKRKAAQLLRPMLVAFDRFSNRRVDQMLANSDFVAERIRHHYHRSSKVLHPFVELADFPESLLSIPKENFYLVLSAFAPNKRIDLAIDAFRARPQDRLIIVGDGTERDRLLKEKPANVEFRGKLDRQEILKLLAQTRALIFPGVEDFGITPLEALAAGTPVVAFRAGGVLETLNENVAEFFNEPAADSLSQAIDRASKRDWNRKILRARAQNFSREKFQQGLIQEVRELMREKAAR